MPQRGASNEYLQHMFLWRNKKDISIFLMKKHLICCYDKYRLPLIYLQHYNSSLYLRICIPVSCKIFFSMAESTGVEKRVSEPEPTLKASSVDSKYSVQALSLLAEVRNHINQKKFIHWKNGSVSDRCIYGILHICMKGIFSYNQTCR